MSRSLDKKANPLSMRMPEADLAMIDRVARLRGRSRTDFVRDAAVRAAEDVIMETALIRMSASGFDAVVIDAPHLILHGRPHEAARVIESFLFDTTRSRGVG